MQFYKEYLNNSLVYGKLIFENEKYYVNNIEVNNNRGIIDDDVYILDGNIVGIKERTIKNIVGILYLDSKIKFGNLKNKPLYLFKPTNRSYPNFYIPYSNNKTNKIYVIIQFKQWDIYNKLPIGTLIEVLGDVGNKEVEFEHLRFYYNVKNNTWKIDSKKEDDIKILNGIEKEDYTVFSIDPIGSKDIDDAFHFKILEDKFIEIGIHIASPVIFFEKDLNKIFDRVSTIYSPIKNYNLLPDSYSTNIVSLLEGEKRFALSLICKINDLNLIDYTIKETVVKNIRNYSYEEFDSLKSKKFVNFIEFTKKFFKLDNIDSHKLVEVWMIYTNKMIAQDLINKNISNIILRVHNSKVNNSKINTDHQLINYLNIRSENSATYQLYDNLKDQRHSKLGDLYTHFTSPIRRCIDFYIHMLILGKHIDYTHEELYKIVEKINLFTKNAKKFDRNVKRLEFLYNIKNLGDNIITYGYIVKISNYYIKLFIPEYNLEEKVILINNKFKNIAEIEVIKNETDNIEIRYNIDNINKKYCLFEKVNIKLWVFTSCDNIFDKLKIEIF